MQTALAEHKRQIFLADIYNEIKSMREDITDRLDKLIAASIPVEEISDDEMLEIDKLSEEMKRGDKFSLEDVLTELDV